MQIRFEMAIVLLFVALAVCVGGCMHSHDSSLSDSASDPKRGDVNGYYEQNYEGAVYVVGSIQSLDKLRAGKPPQTIPGGFSSQGLSVLVETNNSGLSERLMAEYEKRHGLAR